MMVAYKFFYLDVPHYPNKKQQENNQCKLITNMKNPDNLHKDQDNSASTPQR